MLNLLFLGKMTRVLQGNGPSPDGLLNKPGQPLSGTYLECTCRNLHLIPTHAFHLHLHLHQLLYCGSGGLGTLSFPAQNMVQGIKVRLDGR